MRFQMFDVKRGALRPFFAAPFGHQILTRMARLNGSCVSPSHDRLLARVFAFLDRQVSGRPISCNCSRFCSVASNHCSMGLPNCPGGSANDPRWDSTAKK